MNLKNSKEAILNQAVSIFGRLGFHKTTMSDIASASKRGRRTIYTYFKTKEEVYEAVIEREINKIIETIQANQPATCLPDECFRIYINQRIWAIIDLTNRFDAFKNAYFKNYNWVEKIRRELDAKDHLILLGILNKGLENNQFKNIDPNKAVDDLMRIVKGFEFVLIMENQPDEIQTRIDNLNTILLNGLLTR